MTEKIEGAPDSMNDSRTCTDSDPELTQPRSPGVHGDAYFVHLVRDVYRALPWMPKGARHFAYNLIELLEHDVMSAPVLGDHPLQQPKRLIMRQLVAFERAMAAGRPTLQ